MPEVNVRTVLPFRVFPQSFGNIFYIMPAKRVWRTCSFDEWTWTTYGLGHIPDIKLMIDQGKLQCHQSLHRGWPIHKCYLLSNLISKSSCWIQPPVSHKVFDVETQTEEELNANPGRRNLHSRASISHLTVNNGSKSPSPPSQMQARTYWMRDLTLPNNHIMPTCLLLTTITVSTFLVSKHST